MLVSVQVGQRARPGLAVIWPSSQGRDGSQGLVARRALHGERREKERFGGEGVEVGEEEKELGEGRECRCLYVSLYIERGSGRDRED